MGSIQRELRPSIQREDELTMETKLEQIAVKAVNQLPKSVVREIRTPRSVGAGGGRPPPATRWARRNPRPYRDHPTAWTCAEKLLTLGLRGSGRRSCPRGLLEDTLIADSPFFLPPPATSLPDPSGREP